MLQEAVMERCNAHCDTCEVDTVATILEDCELDDGSGMAVESLCSYIPEEVELGQQCSALQTALARSCEDDCAGCDLSAVDVILAGCILDGQPQVPGEAFCVASEQCSMLQHAAMGRCIANCGTCDVPDTQTIVGTCVTDMEVIEGGVRAADVRVVMPCL